MSKPQPDPRAQKSEDTSEDSDALIEALDDRLVRLQGEVGLNGGETRLKEDQIPQPPTPLQPVVSYDKNVQEELDQVQQSDPKEESKEEQVGDAEGVHSNTDSGEAVPYSVIHGEDTSSEEVRPLAPSPPRSPSPAPLHNDWEIIPLSTEMSKLQPNPGAQQSEDTSEDSDAIIEALDDCLVRIYDEVGLNGSALGRLHGRVVAGET
ncbi:hypothetical protein L1987_40283 [Smallanthus sonchifolius]|uniref:Uncharacterized protein n=1 Tax=Smallanthus sonchifolius TaxID=185202 RepID=A0ACB9GSL4_9ASTR|nr:hypothetical protein L1987_40283 [Smallanthus sonchifolius]